MLLELPLVECSRVFISLNVGQNIFKEVEKSDEEETERNSKSLIDGYIQRPCTMESVSLIDAATSWIYNPIRRNEFKWNARKNAAIVGAWPRFITIPKK